MESFEISYLFVSLIKYLLDVKPLKTLICGEHHNVVKQVVYLVRKLIVIAVFSSYNGFGSFFADLFAYLIDALIKRYAV